MVLAPIVSISQSIAFGKAINGRPLAGLPFPFQLPKLKS
jgi:hypothetical protein